MGDAQQANPTRSSGGSKGYVAEKNKDMKKEKEPLEEEEENLSWTFGEDSEESYNTPSINSNVNDVDSTTASRTNRHSNRNKAKRIKIGKCEYFFIYTFFSR